MLLMKEAFAEPRQPLPRQDLRIEAGEAKAVHVRRGQLLRIQLLEDGGVASIFGFTAEPEVFLSVHHTRVFSNSYMLGLGMRLVTNRRRPLMVLGQDCVGHHDLLMPASTSAYLEKQGYAGQKGCVEAVREVLDGLNIRPAKLPDPINLFMHIGLNQDGDLQPLPSRAKAGDFVTFRVVIDTDFVISACNPGLPHNDRPGALAVSVVEDLSEF